MTSMLARPMRNPLGMVSSSPAHAGRRSRSDRKIPAPPVLSVVEAGRAPATPEFNIRGGTMTIGRFAKQVALSTLALINLAAFVPSLEAADDHDHAMTAAGPMTADQQNRANALVAAVRAATERFKNVAVAEAEGYALQFGCVSGGDLGAMGLHFVNGGLVDGELDPARPEIVLYEAL